MDSCHAEPVRYQEPPKFHLSLTGGDWKPPHMERLPTRLVAVPHTAHGPGDAERAVARTNDTDDFEELQMYNRSDSPPAGVLAGER